VFYVQVSDIFFFSKFNIAKLHSCELCNLLQKEARLDFTFTVILWLLVYNCFSCKAVSKDMSKQYVNSIFSDVLIQS